MAANEAKVKFTADTTEFNSAIKSANTTLKELKSALQLNATQMQSTSTSTEGLRSKLQLLQSQSQTLADKKEALNAKLQEAVKYFGEDSDEAAKLRTQLNQVENESAKVSQQIDATNQELKEQEDNANKSESALEKLTNTINSQESELAQLKEQYVNAVLEYGSTSDQAQELAGQITSLSGELKDNKDKMADAEQAADDLDQTMEEGGETAESAANGGWTTFKQILSNLATQAIQQAAQAIKEFAKEVVETGSEAETAFAKLETISGTENIDALKDSITQLSNETGVASADLANVAYNAISAGSSAEDAMDMVTAATKLGVAGFTDADSALSVLSTAMNSYGESAGTAAEISDSLIEVQNLGVTTIGDLSSSIGKAIATGSAYSVSLGNLESAYVSVTKAGIDTNEATTYINSMMNELGDSGSNVSQILQEKTGKSFTELMEDGQSLGDVLGILYDACGDDSTAMMNLWSSQEAGKASNAIINQGLEDFNENLDTITNSAGATEEAYSVMADTFDTKMDKMSAAMDNLKIAIFDDLKGPLGDAASLITDTVIPAVTDIWDNISAFGDDLADFASGIDLGPLSSAFADLSGNISPVVDVISNGLKWAYDNVLKPLASWTIEAGLPALLQQFSDALGVIKDAAEKLADKFSGVTDKLQELADKFSGSQTVIETIQTIWETFCGVFQTEFEGAVDIVTTVLDTALGVLEGILDVFIGVFTGDWDQAWQGVQEIFSSVWDGISSIFSTVLETIQNIASTAWNGIQTVISNVLSTISSIVSSAWNTIKSTISNVINNIKSTISNVFSSIKSTISNVLNNIKSTFSSIWSSIKSAVSTAISGVKTTISNGITGAYTTVTNILTNIKNKFTSIFSSVKTTVANAISNIRSKFNFSWSLPKLKMPHVSITGSFSLSPPSVPKFSISWYKEGGILDAATIFGASGNNLLAGGEAGPEAVAPIDVLQSYVETAVNSSIGDGLDRMADAIEAMAARPIMLNVNGRTLAIATAGDNDAALGSRQALTQRGLAL